MKDTTQKMDQTAEQMNRSVQQSGRILNGYLVETRQINAEFTRRTTEAWIEAFRKQTELNQRMVQKRYGEPEGQTGAFQDITQRWMKLSAAPFFNPFGFDPSNYGPFTFFREGMQMAARNAEWMSKAMRRGDTMGAAAKNGAPR